MSDCFIILAQCGSTYFLTEQGQTQLELELPTNLQPLASCKLVTKNLNEPSKNREVSLYFWHIPNKKLIQEFEWTKSIYDLPLYFGVGFVQDIRLHEGKFTILLFSQYTSGNNKPGKFRVIQFDPQYKPSAGWLARISSAVKSIYYAFPGK